MLELCSLFDESLSVVDSFKPVYSFDKGSTGQTIYRLGLLVALVAFIVWAASQPTEFDGFLAAQKDFVDDLYSGTPLRLPFVSLYPHIRDTQYTKVSRRIVYLSDFIFVTGNLLTDYSQSAKDSIDR